MNIIGRITKDSVVKIIKDERQVVEFSVAVNDYYKPKGSEKGVNAVAYFNCSYWLSTKIAEQLKKGALVEINGRVSVNAYNDMEGNAKASLNFHVNSITIHQFPKGEGGKAVTAVSSPAEITEPIDDLPF